MNAPKQAAQAAQNSTALEMVARVGYVVLGIVHIVIGIIAASVAVGGGGGDADQGGAMQQIRNAPAGVFVLWVIGLGLIALAIWQVTEAFVERDPDTKKRWALRAKYLGTAVAYAAIAVTALIFAVGGSTDSEESTESFSAQLMSSPGGVFLVGALGVGIIALGVAFVIRGATRAFAKNLKNPGGTVGKGIITLGVVGYIAKGIAIGVAGILFVAAAVTHDPEKAGGLDDGLRAIAELPFGKVILWAVGAGLVLYGIFCIARARYARM